MNGWVLGVGGKFIEKWGLRVDYGVKWSNVAPPGVTRVGYEVKVRGASNVSWYPIPAPR
jgi:hypothetical protein